MLAEDSCVLSIALALQRPSLLFIREGSLVSTYVPLSLALMRTPCWLFAVSIIFSYYLPILGTLQQQTVFFFHRAPFRVSAWFGLDDGLKANRFMVALHMDAACARLVGHDRNANNMGSRWRRVSCRTGCATWRTSAAARARLRAFIPQHAPAPSSYDLYLYSCVVNGLLRALYLLAFLA